MVQCDLIQVDVAFLTYNEMRSADNPIVKLDNSCVASMAHLNRHREKKRREKEQMGPTAYHHYKWYNSMLANELRNNGIKYKLKICHWYIESGNKEAFKMNDVLYRAVSVIITPEMEHWYCANTGPDAKYSYGSRYRNVNLQAEHQLNTSKMANLAISGQKPEALASNIRAPDPTSNKCTKDQCANNCMNCKKNRSAFSNSTKTKCACYIEKKLRKIDESDESDDITTDSDIALQDLIVINNLKKK